MNKYKQAVIKELKSATGLKDIELSTPPKPEMGDYAFPCFVLSKKMKKKPNDIAEELCKTIKLKDPIKEVKVVGPFLNFFINKNIMAKDILTDVAKQKEKFGSGTKKKEKVMIEYHQPNTHKGFHVGHLRNAALGDALIRGMRFAGYNVVAASYPGDIGAHIAKCIWFYNKFHKGKEPKEKKGEWLGEIYTDATKYVEDHLHAKEEIEEVQRKLEANDKILTALWKKTKKWSMDEIHAITKELGLNVDVWIYESDVEEAGKKIAKNLLKKGIAEISDGATLVNLEKYGLKVFLVLKSDGSALYSTKDLELARKKFKDFKIDKSIYVIGSEQKLYLQQLFKTLELMGFKQAKKCYHLSYELVMLAEGKMSSRSGNVVLYSHLRDEMLKQARREVQKRHEDWKLHEVELAAKQLAYGAMKFGMLTYDNNKTIIFDIKKMLDFEGETAAYVQYAHARISSILRRVDFAPGKSNFKVFDTDEEFMLIKFLSDFPDLIESVADKYKPNLLPRYLLDLAQAFNEFYHKCPILKAEQEVRDARLLLATAVQQVLKNGLSLMGIEAPDKM